jgi:predicted Zn-ribbon and HTH transcriptional regulator
MIHHARSERLQATHDWLDARRVSLSASAAMSEAHSAAPVEPVTWRRTSRGDDLPPVFVASTQESLFEDLEEKEAFVWMETKEGKRVLHCIRCGYYWTPRAASDEPKKCAKCRSLLWNTPRTYQLSCKPNERPMRKRTTKQVGRLKGGK